MGLDYSTINIFGVFSMLRYLEQAYAPACSAHAYNQTQDSQTEVGGLGLGYVTAWLALFEETVLGIVRTERETTYGS